MNGKLATVQRLVNALDNSRRLYDGGAHKATYPDLQDLLERIAVTHWLIADDLAGQMVQTGGELVRQGSRLGPLRSFLAEKFAQINVDIDMVYASHAARREAGILRDFRDAAASIRYARLRNRLWMHCREIERASTEIRCLPTTMQLHKGLRTARVLANVHVPARLTAPQIVERNSHTSHA